MPRFKGRLFAYSVDIATNAGVLIANDASLNPTDVVAVEVWFKPSPYLPLIMFDNSQVGATFSYFVSAGTNGKVAWFSTIGGLSKNITGVGSARFNEANLISGVYNGTNVIVFLNGAQVGILAATGNLGVNTGQLRLGQYFSGAVAVRGEITQPRIYHRNYTLTDHQERYYNNRDDAVIRSDLVLDMPMTEGSGTTIADVSGEGNNGTFTRNVWTTDTPFKEKVINAVNRIVTEGRAATSGRISTN